MRHATGQLIQLSHARDGRMTDDAGWVQSIESSRTVSHAMGITKDDSGVHLSTPPPNPEHSIWEGL